MNTDETLAKAKKALDKAKIQLMSSADSAFFTTVCLSLKQHIDYSEPTAATDGLSVWYNPDFLLSLTPAEQLFLMLHETLHVAFMHMLRAMGFDARKFNRAADYVINAILIARGFQMPKGGLYDPQYEGMSVEQVYKIMPDPPPPPPSNGGGQGDPSQGDPRQGPGDFGSDLRDPGQTPGSTMTREQAEAEITDILVRASIQSKMAGDKPGTIPGDIEIFLQKILNPKLPWQQILRRYMTGFSKSDYTFKKPNRRLFPRYFVPSLHSDGLTNIAVAFDGSASVSDDEFCQQVSDVHHILKKYKPERIDMVLFDADIRSVDVVKSAKDLLTKEFKARGGTRIGPVMDWARANKPELLLVFSDGCFGYDEDMDPKVPVVWLIYDNPKFKPPFGKTIHFSMD